MSRVFYMPSVIINGSNSLEEAGSRIYPGRKALLVTGKIVVQQECTKRLLDILASAGVSFEIFNDIVGEPDDKMVAAGVDAYTAAGCDFLIAVGGGSPIDLMKAVAVKLKYPDCKLREFMGKEIAGPFVPMIAIPTTAGTGSEATMFTVITDTETDVKMLLKGPDLIPDVAVIDSDFSISAPRNITANTGIDALTHAIESYTSVKAQPLTDVLAVSAVKRIMKYLPVAYNQGDDREARTQMALAALEAGVCITNASVTLVHGMSRPIGALFHIPHGLSNAMLLSECLAFAMDGACEKFAVLGKEIGIAADDDDNKTAALLFLGKVMELCKICNIPTLQDYGVDKEVFFSKIEKMAADAMASGSPGNTIKKVSAEDCVNIYKALWD